MEVERGLRVLDGAVLVLYAVSSVQVGSPGFPYYCRVKQLLLTVKCNVPRLSFINKMDRCSSGLNRPPLVLGPLPADLVRICGESSIRSGQSFVCQLRRFKFPIGIENQLEGLVDLVRWKAIYNKGVKR